VPRPPTSQVTHQTGRYTISLSCNVNSVVNIVQCPCFTGSLSVCLFVSNFTWNLLIGSSCKFSQRCINLWRRKTDKIFEVIRNRIGIKEFLKEFFNIAIQGIFPLTGSYLSKKLIESSWKFYHVYSFAQRSPR